MNNKKYQNLKHWQPGQSGYPAGRKPGSKNIATIVRELLDQEANADMLAKSSIAEQVKDTSTTYAKAVVLATIHKALQGSIQAVNWLAEQQERDMLSVAQLELSREQPVVITKIKPRHQSTVD